MARSRSKSRRRDTRMWLSSRGQPRWMGLTSLAANEARVGKGRCAEHRGRGKEKRPQ